MWYPNRKKTHFYSHAGLLFCLFFIILYLFKTLMLLLFSWTFFFLFSLFWHCSEGIWSTNLHVVILKDLWKTTGIYLFIYIYILVCIKSHCKTQWWAWNFEINILSYSCFTGITWGSICVPCWRWLGNFWGTRCKENSLEWPAYSWPRNNDLGWDWCHVRYNWQLQKHKQYLFFIFWLFERIGKFC